MPDQPSNNLSLLPEFKLLWQRRWWLVAAIVTGFLAGFLLSLPSVTPREYRASAAFIPPNLREVQSFRGRTGGPGSYAGLGTAGPQDLEQMLMLLVADTTRRRMQETFRLKEHYRIKSDGIAGAKSLDKKYDKKVSIVVGSNSTIEITVFDEDPAVATRMANYLLAWADTLLENLARRRSVLASLQLTEQFLTNRRQVLLDSLAWIRTSYGLFDLKYISDAAATVATQRLLTRQSLPYYDRLLVLEQELGSTNSQLLNTQTTRLLLEESIRDFPTLLVQKSPAVTPLYPARPRRLFIISGVMLSLVAISALAILMAPRVREFREHYLS